MPARGSGVRIRPLNASAPDSVEFRGGPERVEQLEFSPNGALLFAADGPRCWVWNVGQPDRDPQRLEWHDESITNLGVSPDGNWLATCSEDNTVRIQGLRGQGGRTLFGHTDDVFSMSFDPHSRWLITSGDDYQILAWDLEALNELPLVARGHEGFVRQLLFSPTGRYAASTSDDCTVRLWEVNRPHGDPAVLEGQWPPVPEGLHMGPGQDMIEIGDPQVRFDVDGGWLALETDMPTARLWSTDGFEPRILPGVPDTVRSVRFFQDSSRLCYFTGDSAFLAETARANVLQSFPRFSSEILDVAVSPDGSNVLTAEADGCVRIWAVGTPQEPRVIRSHEGPVTAVVFAASGTHFASAGKDGRVVVHAAAGDELRRLGEHAEGVRALETDGVGSLSFPSAATGARGSGRGRTPRRIVE